MTSKIWANSGDSHVMEPEDLFVQRMPKGLAERAPATIKDERHETVTIDGQTVFRTLLSFTEAGRAPGAYDLDARLVDLDAEGVMNQVMFPSVGLWLYRITDQELSVATAQAYNDWMVDEVMSHSGRLLPVGVLPVLDTADTIAELQRAAGLGFKTLLMPTSPPEDRPYNSDVWEPLWSAAEEAAMVLSFHVGTGADPRMFRGPGAVIINYVETFVPGQRTVAHLTASGVLDRHPGLRILIAEGGASWVPALADRLDEGFRQHGAWANPKLSRLPSEMIYEQVYASFQHDVSAVPAFASMGYRNVMWGDDYPHAEGTFGHTQETLHGLFDSVEPEVLHAITVGAFDRLFGTTTEVPVG